MKKSEGNNFALITGGSSGIGLAFARELAAAGHNLILVSHDPENLTKVAADLENKFGVDVEILPADLSEKTDLEKIQKRLTDEKNPVDMLINCAGFVLRDSLIHGNLARQHAAFQVMAEAILVLSQTATKIMRRRNRGTIINIASTSAWLYNGNYSAIKRWVVVYTQSLAIELLGKNVRVTAVCPGETLTDFHARGGINRPGLPKWLWCTPEQIARQGLRAAEKNKNIFVPTVKWRVIVWCLKTFQFVAKTASRKMIVKRIAEMDAKDGRNEA